MNPIGTAYLATHVNGVAPDSLMLFQVNMQ